MVKTEVIDLTPEISERFMSMNTKNRKLSPKLVDSYAKDMKEGRWYANGEPIIISNNVLISGQHRCLAVIKSGVTLKDTVIVYTDEPEMVDTGRVRSVTDLTGIPPLISAAVSTCLAMTIKKHNVSKALIIEKYSEWEPECEFVYKIIDNRKRGLRKSGIVGAVLAARLCGYPEDMLENFCRVLLSGEMEKPQDKVIILLRDAAITSTNGGGTAQKTMYLKTQAALKIYIEGRTVTKLYPLMEPYYKISVKEEPCTT
jgi:hypothetical protein